MELELGTTPHDALDPNQPTAATTDQRTEDKHQLKFDNPLYAKVDYSKSESTDSLVEPNISSEATSVENPLFSLQN